MKVALIGATGKAGSRILSELVSRGHVVTAMARDVSSLSESDQVKPRALSGNGEDITEAVAGHDAVVSSVRFVDLDPDILVSAVLKSGVGRYVVVGGAGGLKHPDGVAEVDQPGFPAPAKPNSERGVYMLELLKASKGISWTFICPPRMFVPGERTGKFRYGKDDMLMVDGQPTSISFEDFAIVVADEVETPKHVNERFTIGY
ncbi:NAD(P)-dependent oxidoreductase [Rhizobium sp. L1K21]|uniref:NAD(P)-dependent oxidoreductase n=1 Tax=Rhizobium sp. L1K21 TaxID=2954933 RepID=UPI002092C77F|nr:NAD(P)H-binding protein [Rhizobium sp. L1K21]MCO6187595.1 NAD(P)H-binding protein [Rhizobium sp. L1K21]